MTTLKKKHHFVNFVFVVSHLSPLFARTDRRLRATGQAAAVEAIARQFRRLTTQERA